MRLNNVYLVHCTFNNYVCMCAYEYALMRVSTHALCVWVTGVLSATLLYLGYTSTVPFVHTNTHPLFTP